MKTVSILAAVLFLSAAPACEATEASYNEQMMELIYHIFHLSNINVINGLNLSRDQALKLRDMAREVERTGVYVPTMRDKMPAELAEVRKTYVELAKFLQGGGEVSEELAQRVLKAREAEARVIREGLSERPTAQDKGLCLRCHLPPERIRQLRGARGGTSAEGGALDGKGYYNTPKLHQETDAAHLEGLLGKAGAAKVRDLGPRVSALLTDAQKEVLGSFSCCLVPPKNLSDPVRVGQASVTDKKVQLLRQVREVPAARWEQARERLIDRLVEIILTKKTGISEQQLAEYRAHLSKVFEEVRGLSDTEFEMRKEQLCARLDLNAVRPPDGAPQREFKQAAFLLAPGSARVYDALLGRTARPR